MKVYSLPDDMKDYKAPDAFQLIEESDAGMWIVIFLIIGIVMEPYLR